MITMCIASAHNFLQAAQANVMQQGKYSRGIINLALFGVLDEKDLKGYLAEGFDINAMMDGYTPLIAANIGGEVDAVNLLIKAGADINKKDSWGQTALMMAVKHSHTSIIKTLIKAKAHLDIQDALGCTALMQAAYHDDRESIIILLKAGANSSLKSYDEETIAKNCQIYLKRL